ncbi:hypothetical protein ACFL1M_00660 [Patescibacteria group bacterium]
MTHPEEKPGKDSAVLENNTDPLVEIAQKTLKSLSRSPETDLQKAMEEYIGVDGNGNGIPKKIKQKAKELVEAGNHLDALVLIASNVSVGPIPKKPTQNLKRKKKEVRRSLPEKDRLHVKSESSKALKLGSAAHRLIEEIRLCKGELSEISANNIKFENEERISEYEITQQDDESNIQGSFVISEGGAVTAFQMPGHPKISTRTVKLQYEMANPNTFSSIEEWALSYFSQAFLAFEETFGRVPHKPFDVEQISKNKRLKEHLVKSLQAGQILFGDRRAMNIFDPPLPEDKEERKEKGQHSISYEHTTEYQILNWLTIMRASFESVDRPQTDEEGLITELPFGNIALTHTLNEGQLEEIGFTIKGGTADLIKINLETFTQNQTEALTGTPLGNHVAKKTGRTNVALATNHIEKLFGAQMTRYRRKDETGLPKLFDDKTEYEKMGEKVGREVRTKLNRNFRSLAKELFRLYGDDLFNEVEFNIQDFKFPAGDGGWFSIFDEKGLPVNGHEDQIKEYIFLAVTQLCWVQRWSQDEGENFSLSIDDVIDFSYKSGILNRMKGELLYQLPDQERIEPVELSTLQELREVGLKVISERLPGVYKENELRIVKALQIITGHRDVEVKLRPQKELPENINHICFEHDGHLFLSIEDLKKTLFDTENRPNIENAIYFKDEKTYVFWVSRIDQENLENLLRVAINVRGEFGISGLPEGVVKGKIASSLEQRGVRENRIGLIELFNKSLWKKLTTSTMESLVSSDQIINSRGERRSTVKDKPIFVEQDPLTGRWIIDQKALQRAIDTKTSTKDPHGLTILADLLNKEKPYNKVFCPLPHHDNRNTEAAHLHEDHVYCYGCQENILLPWSMREFNVIPMKSGNEVEDFNPVSSGRSKAFENAITIAHNFSLIEDVSSRFLRMRGLNHELAGMHGHFPPHFAGALANLVSETTEENDKRINLFNRAVKESKKIDRKILKEPLSVLVQSGYLSSSHPQIFALLQSLHQALRIPQQNSQQDSFIKSDSTVPPQIEAIDKILTLENIQSMRNRGIIGRNKVGNERIGGRLVLPTYWLKYLKSGYQFTMANVNARGIYFGEESMHQGDPHFKAFVRSSQRVRDGRKMRQTPPGFWMPDPKRFTENLGDTIFIFEGPLNQLSFNQISPEYRDSCITVSGTGYRQIIALLRWLGVCGDHINPQQTLGKGIKRVVLASDWDKGGAEAFKRNRSHIMSAFHEVDVLPINYFLPEDIRTILPFPIITNFSPKTQQNAQGSYFGFKLDLNDVIRKPEGRGWAHQSSDFIPINTPINQPRMKI